MTEDKNTSIILSNVRVWAFVEQLKNQVNSHEFWRSSLIHTLTSGPAPCRFHKMYSKLPQSSLSVGSGTRHQARSKILTLHRASGSHHVSCGNKVPLFPESVCRWQSFLHSSLPMLWWLLPEEGIDFCWHWKDAQQIKITKSSDNSLCRHEVQLLNDAWPGCIEKRCFPGRSLCECCLWLGGGRAWQLRGRRCWCNICNIPRMATSLEGRLVVQKTSEASYEGHWHIHSEHQISLAPQVILYLALEEIYE